MSESRRTGAVDAEREAFEEAAFAQYFLSTIKRNPSPPRGAGALDFVSEGCKTKAEFLARDNAGNYSTDTLNAAWWAWQERSAKDTAEQKLDYLKSCGLTVSLFKESGKPARWLYSIVEGSELCDRATLRKLTDAELAISTAVKELTAAAHAIEDRYNAEDYDGDLDADELEAETIWRCIRSIQAASTDKQPSATAASV